MLSAGNFPFADSGNIAGSANNPRHINALSLLQSNKEER
jgi:hypothetical protein